MLKSSDWFACLFLAMCAIIILWSFLTPTWNDPCRTDIDTRTGHIVYQNPC